MIRLRFISLSAGTRPLCGSLFSPALRLSPSVRAATLALVLTPVSKVAADDAAIPLDEVVVVATRTERKIDETPGTVTVIDLVDDTALAPADYGQLVRREPLVSAPFLASGTGVAYQRSGYTSLNIRGIEGNRVLQQIDGIRVPDEFRLGGSEPIGRDYLEPELFRRVELLQGSASALYGSDALGGVVSFVTKSPEDFLARTERPVFAGYKAAWRSGDESLAHTGTAAASAGPLQALVVYTRRDGHELENNGAVAPNPEDWSSDAALTKLVWTPAAAHRVELAFDWIDRRGEVEIDNKETTTGTATTSELRTDSDTERFRLSAGYTFRPGTSGPAAFDQLEARVYLQDASTHDRTHELITYNPPCAANGAFRDRHITTAFHNDTAGFSAAAVKALGSAHRLAYGVEGSQTETSKPWWSVTTTARSGTAYPVEPRMAETETDRLGAYLQDEFTFAAAGRRVTFIPGVRVDQFKLTPDNSPLYLAATAGQAAPAFDEVAVSPKLGVVVALTDTLNAYGQYNRGFRYPTAEDLTATFTNPTTRYRTIPNPNLKEETSDAFEVGLKGQPIGQLTVRAAAFYTTYDNFIEQIAFAPLAEQDFVNWPAGTFQTQNRASAHIYGGELSVRMPLSAGFSLQAAAGYAKGSYETDDGARTALSTIEPFKANAVFAYDAANHRYGAAAAVEFADGKRPGDGTLFRAPAYTTVDLTSYWRIRKYVTLNVGLYNLTDEQFWRYANIRGLSATAFAEQQRRSEPGFNAAVSLALSY